VGTILDGQVTIHADGHPEFRAQTAEITGLLPNRPPQDKKSGTKNASKKTKKGKVTEEELALFEQPGCKRLKTTISRPKFEQMKIHLNQLNRNPRYTSDGDAIVVDEHKDPWCGQPSGVVVQWRSSGYVPFVRVVHPPPSTAASRFIPLSVFDEAKPYTDEVFPCGAALRANKRKVSGVSCSSSSSASSLATPAALEEQSYHAKQAKEKKATQQDRLEEEATWMSKLSDLGFIYKKHKIAELGSGSGFVLCSPAAWQRKLPTQERGETWEVQVSAPLQPAIVEMAQKLCAGQQAACRVDLLARDADEHETNDDKILSKWAQQEEQEERQGTCMHWRQSKSVHVKDDVQWGRVLFWARIIATEC
jgi:hypothetical protein